MGGKVPNKEIPSATSAKTVVEVYFHSHYKVNLDKETTLGWKVFQIELRNKIFNVSSGASLVKSIDLPVKIRILLEEEENLSLIILLKESSAKIYKVRFLNAEEYVYWIYLLKVIARPTWELKSFCEHCEKKFGILRRRHHCRRCGRSICKKCTAAFTTLPEFDYMTPERICNECDSRVCRKSALNYIKSN